MRHVSGTTAANWLRLGWRPRLWDFGMRVELVPFRGLRVLEVELNGPAARAGLEPGDLIAGTTRGSFRRTLCQREALQQLESAVQRAAAGRGNSVTVYVQDQGSRGIATTEVQPRRAFLVRA